MHVEPVAISPSLQAPRRCRAQLAAAVVVAREDLAAGKSCRQSSAAQRIPPTTLFRAMERLDALDADPDARAFYDGPHGLRLLHHLVLVLILVLVFESGLGVDKVRRVLLLAGIGRRVACSPSHLRSKVVAIRRIMLEFEREQTADLVPTMPHRTVTLCPDEMFRCGKIILTAPDPVSGMLLVHQTGPRRDAVTWGKAIECGTQRLTMTLAGLCADRAGGIQSAAEEQLEVAFYPELFHVQKGVQEAFGRPLQRQVTATHKARSKAAVQALRLGLEPGAPAARVDLGESPELHAAALALTTAEQAMREAQEAHKTLGEVSRTLSLALHPVDLHTGAPRDPEEVEGAVEDQLRRLDPLAARLGEDCQKALRSAREVIPAWKDMVTQWHARVTARVQQEVMSAGLQWVMLTWLIPAYYLAWVSGRNHLPTAVRKYLRAQSEAKLRQVAAHAEWQDLPRGLRVHLASVAQECARWFVRSSSPTEGHNAWTSHRLHRHHGVRDEWLSALKVVHNFVLRRADGTTAAERFYGRAHGDLVEYLCARMPLPPLPRNRRPKPRPDPLQLTG